MSGRPSVPIFCCLLLTACTGAGMGGAAIASPSAASASATPVPTPTATASPTPEPTLTSSPSPSPTPSPTPDGGVAVLELDAIGCPGGVVLDWSATTDPRFHHYTALRSPEREIETAYPPIAPAVDWGDTFSTDPFVTSAVDASIVPSERVWNYRVMAYDVNDAVLAASPVRQARLLAVQELGAVTVAAAPDGSTTIDWRSFGGAEECFTSYRILFGLDAAAASSLLSVIPRQSDSELVTDALHPGTSYTLRVQAMRSTTLGSFVVAETSATEYVVP